MKIFLIGFMGCGKTHWGKQLSLKLQIPFFDLDEKVEEHEDKSIPKIFAEEGEEYFRLLEKDVLHLLVESHDSFVMACGGGTPCFFNTIDYLKKSGTVIWLNCSVRCLHKRLASEKEKRPLISKLSDAELLTFIQKKYASRRIFYEQASIIMNEEELNFEKLMDKVFHP